MSRGLPTEVIDPVALAKRGASYQGTIDVDSLPRLRELLVEKQGQIEVELRFAEEAYLPATMAGKINAQLVISCQRCGDPMTYTVKSCPTLRIVRTEEQAKKLSRGEEALVTQGADVNLIDLVEDEVLLSLPMIAKHEESECKISPPYEF